ncbi:MAG: hypothetical protein AAGF99_00250 [Bacteroidota bacterium]
MPKPQIYQLDPSPYLALDAQPDTLGVALSEASSLWSQLATAPLVITEAPFPGLRCAPHATLASQARSKIKDVTKRFVGYDGRDRFDEIESSLNPKKTIGLNDTGWQLNSALRSASTSITTLWRWRIIEALAMRGVPTLFFAGLAHGPTLKKLMQSKLSDHDRRSIKGLVGEHVDAALQLLGAAGLRSEIVLQVKDGLAVSLANERYQLLRRGVAPPHPLSLTFLCSKAKAKLDGMTA